MNKTTITVIGAVIVLGAVIWFARPSSPDSADSGTPSVLSGALAAEESSFDFGAISMAGGNVARTLTIKNTGESPITITKVYTSCMCTTATLKIGERTKGPFGMPGHGLVPRIDEALESKEEARVEVVFDPAAHGPAGAGRIERLVFIENSAGKPLELKISATVTP